jgi:energy-converting hydrogenase Eha subunit H
VAEPRLTFYAQHGELFAKICTTFAFVILLAKLLGLLRGRLQRSGEL